MLAVVFLGPVFFLSLFDAFLEVGLWEVCFSLIFLIGGAFGLGHLVVLLLSSSLCSSG